MTKSSMITNRLSITDMTDKPQLVYGEWIHFQGRLLCQNCFSSFTVVKESTLKENNLLPLGQILHFENKAAKSFCLK